MKTKEIKAAKLQMKAILLAGVLVFESIFAGIGTVSAQTVSENGITAEESTSMDVSLSENAAVSENDMTEEVAKRKNLQVQSEQAVAEKAAIKYSGTDGGVNWSIDENGHLLLTGDGDYEGTADWTDYKLRDEIVTAEVRVKNMTSTDSMFYYCRNLKSVDFTGFDTSKVTDMSGMFRNCTFLEKLDLSHFNTSKVTDMGDMFYCCYNLTELDVSHFDTSNVIGMVGMFASCKLLTNLDVSGFRTGNVIDMSTMFSDCMSLTRLDLSNFDTSKVEHVIYMFAGCEKMEELDLSTWNLSALSETLDGPYEIAGAAGMFEEMDKLAKITLPNLRYEIKLPGVYYDDKNALTSIAGINKGIITYMLPSYADSYCAKNGHNYDKPLFIWNTDYKKVRVHFICKNQGCQHLNKITVPAVLTTQTIQPTAEKEGAITYTATVVFQGKTYTETKSVSIPKLPSAQTPQGQKPSETTLNTADVFYRVIKTGNAPELAYMGPKNKKVKKVTIPATVKIDGVTYKVTSVADGALKNYKNLTTVTIGKNVTKIGKNAFYGCKKLKKIVIKSKKLKSIGKNAFKGVKKNATIDVPNSKKKAYKKLLKSKTGYKKTMSVK